MLTSFLSLMLIGQLLNTPSSLQSQHDPVKIAAYFVDAALSGDRELILALADPESLKNRSGDTPRTAVNAFVARLARGGCLYDETDSKNRQKERENHQPTAAWTVQGKELFSVRLFCHVGKGENLTLRKLGVAWKVVIP